MRRKPIVRLSQTYCFFLTTALLYRAKDTDLQISPYVNTSLHISWKPTTNELPRRCCAKAQEPGCAYHQRGHQYSGGLLGFQQLEEPHGVWPDRFKV